jgi:hypothetical protein
VADEAGVPCAMAMFGEALFSLISEDEATNVAKMLEEAVPDHGLNIAKIENQGARLL